MTGSRREIRRRAPFAPATGSSSLGFDSATDLPLCAFGRSPKFPSQHEKQDGTGARGLGMYRAAFAAARGSPQISADFNTKHLFLALVLPGRQVGHSSVGLSWAQLVRPRWVPCVFSLWDQTEETATIQSAMLSGQRQDLTVGT